MNLAANLSTSPWEREGENLVRHLSHGTVVATAPTRFAGKWTWRVDTLASAFAQGQEETQAKAKARGMLVYLALTGQAVT